MQPLNMEISASGRLWLDDHDDHDNHDDHDHSEVSLLPRIQVLTLLQFEIVAVIME